MIDISHRFCLKRMRDEKQCRKQSNKIWILSKSWSLQKRGFESKKNKKIYIGYTSDLQRRLTLHNTGEVFSTKPYKPFVLIYYEAYQNKQDALKREGFLKSGWGKNYLRRTLKHYFMLQKLGRAWQTQNKGV